MDEPQDCRQAEQLMRAIIFLEELKEKLRKSHEMMPHKSSKMRKIIDNSIKMNNDE